MQYAWKKHEKTLYSAKSQPAQIQVPPQQFILLQGCGDPNAADFSGRVSALFSLAYAIKMAYRAAAQPGGVDDFAVYPLEGVWRQGTAAPAAPAPVKAALAYTVMIRQPDWVTAELVQAARARLQAKRPGPLYGEIAFARWPGERCVEILHTGPYDSEPGSMAKMDEYLRQNGLRRATDSHREIYLTQPGRTAPARMKTILRYPVLP